MRIKVMTYNIQHGRNHNLKGDVIDFENTAAPILHEKPDIVGLNEVRAGGAKDYDDQPSILAGICGGTPVFGKATAFGENMLYGNAFISKLPVLSQETIPIPDPEERSYKDLYETRCVLRMTVDCGKRPLHMLTVHFGLNPDEQENAVNTLLDTISRLEGPVILMGDFNVTPESQLLLPLSSVLTNAAAAVGNHDFTFSSDKPERTIDYIWYRGVTPLKFHRVEGIHSDHFPLAAEFEVEG